MNATECHMLKIKGKDIYLRYVEIEDAQFLYSLRTDPVLSKYLNAVDLELVNQIEWIKKYKEREKSKQEYYFIIQLKTGEKMGAVRMYDFRGNSFSWGSWIIKSDSPIYTAIESSLAIYEYGFDYLGFAQSHFEVMKDNARVVAFHKNFGAKLFSEEKYKYHLILKQEDFENAKVKYKRFYQRIKVIDS